jgi:hypothetical protein
VKNEEKFSSQLSAVAKKTTVAAAVAGLCAAGMAATIGTRTTTFSLEGSANRAAASSNASTNLGVVTVTITGTYQAGDEITFTLGADVTGVASGNSVLSCTGSAPPLADESSANVRRFRVGIGATAAGICTLSNLFVLDSSLNITSDVISLSSQSKTNAGTEVDAAPAATIGSVVNELQVAVSTAFNGQIDAKNANRLFTTANSTRTQDELVLRITNLAVTGGGDASLSGASTGSTNPALVIDVTGNFDFLKNGTETCVAGALTGGANKASLAGGGAIFPICSGSSITGLRLAFESTDVTTGDKTVTVELASTGNQVGPTSFAGGTATFNLAGTASNTDVTSGLNNGAFTASGATVFVPFMPVRSDVTNILYITNNSGVDGSVTMSIKGSNGTCTSSAVTASANKVTNLGTAFASALTTACATSNDKVSITITTTTPIQNTEVFSAYAIGNADRLPVINSSNGYKTDADTGVGSGNANNAP